MKAVALATEDILSEAVGIKLLSTYDNLTVGPFLRRDGFGYLKSKASNWRAYAEHQPLVLITDLDTAASSQTLEKNWFGKKPLPSRLLFCVAVREVESWLLADHKGLREILGKNVKLPLVPDDLADPKAFLLNLAKQAPRHIRQDLVKEEGAIASQGIGYNSVLRNFVREKWDVLAASDRSPSLRRTMQQLSELLGK